LALVIKRNNEVAAREERVRKIMDSMGELVNGNKEKELLKKLEKDYIVQCIANDEQSLAQDKQKKQMTKVKNQQLFSVLDKQCEEKNRRMMEE
jgi:hypothetical protein